MRRGDLVSSLFWLLCAILIVVCSLRIPVGRVSNPGPGLIPLFLGVILGIFAIVLFIRSLLQSVSEVTPFRLEKHQAYRVIGTVGAMLVYAFTFIHLGFVTTTLLLMLFLLKVIFKLKWTISVGGAIIISCCAYLLFKVWLGLQLPAGPLGI